MGTPSERLVLIHWVDIVHDSNSWTARQEAIDLKPSDCYTAGFILYEDDDRIVVAGTLGPGTEEDVGDVNVIPRCVIQGICELVFVLPGDQA